MMNKKLGLPVAVMGMMITWSGVQAATVNISGAGFFGTDTTVTTESAPGQTFAFSFVTPNPTTSDPDTSISNPMFTLAGFSIAPTITSVNFYDNKHNGLFDLIFSDHNVLSFYGRDIGSTGFIQSGFYTAKVALDGNDPIGDGFVAVSVNVSSVPLPASAPMFGAALLSLGVAGYMTRQKKDVKAAV